MIIVGNDTSRRHLRYMLLARDVAINAKVERSFLLGAVLVRNNRVISQGINNPNKTHSISSDTRSGSVHAEMDAIVGINRNHVMGADVYVYRHAIKFGASISKPCIHCKMALMKAGVRRVFYIDNNGNIDCLRLN